jgi:thymidylate kinase
MKLIIVEGARGSGKTTMVQELRNTIPQTMVMQLTGMAKTPEEYNNICDHYYNIQQFLESEIDMPYNLVLDRSFFSEYVMAKLYKDYDFSDSYNTLADMLIKSGIELTLVLLTVKDDRFKDRLKREGKVKYQNLEYKAVASIKEQEVYKEIIHKFKEDSKEYDNIKVFEFERGKNL